MHMAMYGMAPFLALFLGFSVLYYSLSKRDFCRCRLIRAKKLEIA